MSKASAAAVRRPRAAMAQNHANASGHWNRSVRVFSRYALRHVIALINGCNVPEPATDRTYAPLPAAAIASGKIHVC